MNISGYRRTERPMDGRTDRRTDPLISYRDTRTHLKMKTCGLFSMLFAIWLSECKSKLFR